MRTLRVLAVVGFLSVITGGGLFLLVLFPTLLKGPTAFLLSKDQPISMDLIVVLSGSPVSRTLEARDLYKGGFSKKILVIPDPPDPLRHELEKLGFKGTPLHISQRILIASGVPMSAVDLLPTHAEGTRVETNLVEAYAEKNAIKSILLVTSPISSRRQCWIFERALPSVRISCQPTAYEEIEYNRRTILWVINEFLKIAANGIGIYSG